MLFEVYYVKLNVKLLWIMVLCIVFGVTQELCFLHVIHDSLNV